jgi:hypothetical protein
MPHALRIGCALFALLAMAYLLSPPSRVFAAQIWTDGNDDGLPDGDALFVDPGTIVEVGLWIDSEGFGWTNYTTFVEWTPGCIEFNSASYVISGGGNFPIDTSSHPSAVGFSGSGYNEEGVNHIGNVSFTVLAPVTCCVTPITSPENPSYVFSYLASGADYQLFDTSTATCYGDPGGPLPGACCFSDGSCAFVAEEACVGAGGVFQGPAAQCASVNCLQLTQACCLPDGACLDLESSEDCSTVGGTMQGAGTQCQTSSCPQPLEACCLPVGICQDLSRSACEILAGIPFGPGTACPVECPQACCFTTGECQDLSAAECVAAGGVARGAGSSCDETCCSPTACPQACCFTNGVCQDLIIDDCVAAGGVPEGAGSTCARKACSP